MKDKFRIIVGDPYKDNWTQSFENFYHHCQSIAIKNNWHIDTVCNQQLKPNGKLIKTKTQGWYLRWDDEKYHNMFILKWS